RSRREVPPTGDRTDSDRGGAPAEPPDDACRPDAIAGLGTAATDRSAGPPAEGGAPSDPQQADEAAEGPHASPEQPRNGGERGPLELVSLGETMITKLRGILLDLDPGRFRPEAVPVEVLANPTAFHEKVIRPMLARHPVLARAEVRVSGRGVHVIIRFAEP